MSTTRLPAGQPTRRKVLVRIDGAGATHALLDRLTGQRLAYSVGFGLPANTPQLLALLPDDVWQVALDRTAVSGTAPGSPSCPACSTCPAGRPACG